MRKIPLLFNDYLKNCKLCYDSEDVKSELKKRLDNIWKPITPKVFDIHDFSVVQVILPFVFVYHNKCKLETLQTSDSPFQDVREAEVEMIS